MTQKRPASISPQVLIQRIESLEIKVKRMESSIYRVIPEQSDRITELESLVNPYTDSGDAICNFDWDKNNTYE